MAVYGRHRMMVREPRFHFLFPADAEDVTGAHSLGAIRTPAVTDAEHVMRNP